MRCIPTHPIEYRKLLINLLVTYSLTELAAKLNKTVEDLQEALLAKGGYSDIQIHRFAKANPDCSMYELCKYLHTLELKICEL